MDYEAAYAKLEARKSLRDEWYDVGFMLFHQLLNDGKWEQENEYRFTRRVEGQKPIAIDLRSDRVWGFGEGTAPRADGLDYLINEYQANGGTLDGLWPTEKQKSAGPLRIIPPYRMNMLSGAEKNYHRNLPPEREQLQLVMRFDESIYRLYFATPGGGASYEDGITSAPAYFIPIAGRWFARWRVISQLLFDNPYGVENLEECAKALSNVPTGPAQWREFNVNAFHDHMSARGDNYGGDRSWLRQSPATRMMQAKIDDAEAKNKRLAAELEEAQKELALRRKFGNAYVDEKMANAKKKEDGEPIEKPLVRRARLDRYLKRQGLK